MSTGDRARARAPGAGTGEDRRAQRRRRRRRAHAHRRRPRRPIFCSCTGAKAPARVEADRRTRRPPDDEGDRRRRARGLRRRPALRGVADFLLIDAKPPQDAALPGGNGRPFDWGSGAGLSSAAALAALRRARPRDCRGGDRARAAQAAWTSPPASSARRGSRTSARSGPSSPRRGARSRGRRKGSRE